MKKFLAATISASLFAIAAPAAQAASTTPQSFNVTASLTAACSVAAIPDLAFGTYVAFQATAIAPTTPFAITCTRGLAAPTFAFDTALGGNNGVIAGLNYSLTAASVVTAPGTPATPGVAGSAATHTVTILGNMPGGQAGDCASGNAATCAAVQTQIRTVTISY